MRNGLFEAFVGELGVFPVRPRRGRIVRRRLIRHGRGLSASCLGQCHAPLNHEEW